MKTRGFIRTGSGMPWAYLTPELLGGRLIPQEGIRQEEDPEWHTHTLTVPFMIARRSITATTFPNTYTPHPELPNMILQKAPDLTHGPIMASGVLTYIGIIDGVLPDLWIPPQDVTTLQTLQIADPNSSAVADVAFYCPQTVWRWVTRDYPQFLPTKFASINDPYNQKKPVPIRYFIRTDPGAAPSDLTGVYRSQQTEFRTERWGLFWRNSLTVQKTYASPFNA